METQDRPGQPGPRVPWDFRASRARQGQKEIKATRATRASREYKVILALRVPKELKAS
jgi:hypothetical protein